MSPKFAMRLNLNKHLYFNASIGRGFKAPDFRQLYLNFTNNAAGGYSVFGTVDAVKIINQMNALGQISELKADFYKLTTLTPEFSTGINIGGGYTPCQTIRFNLNVFRNDIEGLIDSRQVATKSNGAQIFSYINVKNAYTEGIETEITVQPTKNFSISSGYQFLQTADKDELNKIKSKTVYTRNADGTSRLLNKSEYEGLPNRSKNMFNLKLTYQSNENCFATARLLYKSKWYVSDKDGNGLINSNDEFGKSYFITNISAGKNFGKTTNVIIGMDNVLNYKDILYLPNLQGRMIYCSANFKLKK